MCELLRARQGSISVSVAVLRFASPVDVFRYRKGRHVKRSCLVEEAITALRNWRSSSLSGAECFAAKVKIKTKFWQFANGQEVFISRSGALAVVIGGGRNPLIGNTPRTQFDRVCAFKGANTAGVNRCSPPSEAPPSAARQSWLNWRTERISRNAGVVVIRVYQVLALGSLNYLKPKNAL